MEGRNAPFATLIAAWKIVLTSSMGLILSVLSSAAVTPSRTSWIRIMTCKSEERCHQQRKNKGGEGKTNPVGNRGDFFSRELEVLRDGGKGEHPETEEASGRGEEGSTPCCTSPTPSSPPAST